MNFRALGRKIDKIVGGKKAWAALAANIPVVGGVVSGGLMVADSIETEARKRGVSKETIAKEKAEAIKAAADTAKDAAATARFVKTTAPVTVPVLIAIAVVIAVVVLKD